jgi:para-nitrobenzyl esterase
MKNVEGEMKMKTILRPIFFHCSVASFVLAVVIVPTLFSASMNIQAPANLIVSTTYGEIRGVPRPSGGAEFLGIPFAEPPVGDLRWREPLPPKLWKGVRDANRFGTPCAQAVLGEWNRHDSETSKEDCLYLNVITPSWPSKGRLPVMFWIHGGANAGGTASSALYKDGTLVQHGVVLVTVNYRLGVFGFLSHAELTRESSHHASGNYGLMDQITALQWVRDNIAKFGGDPKNITVFGQSAGAQDTSLLMTSPLSKTLFQRAIVQSGSGIMPPMPSLTEAEQSGEKVATALKAPKGDGAIKYLRQLSPQDVLSGLPRQNPSELPLIGPDIDGWVIQRSPPEVFASGQQSAIPLIIGTTSREFGMPAPPGVVRQMIQTVTGSFASRALSLYGLEGDGQGATDPMYGSAGDQWLADLIFRCPVTTQARWHAAAGRATYEYELEHAIPGHEAEGAVHSADLPYVFGYYPKTGNISGNFGEIDFKLADMMQTYWTNFAKTGDPNAGALPKWPEFGTSQTFIRFTQDGSVASSQGLRQSHCDLLREVLKERMTQRK